MQVFDQRNSEPDKKQATTIERGSRYRIPPKVAATPSSIESNLTKLVSDEVEHVAFMGLIFDLRMNRHDPCGDQHTKN